MRILQIVFLCILFVFTAFAQTEQTPEKPPEKSLVKSLGDFDFENPAEQMINFRFIDGGTKLWMLGTNSIQVWDIQNKKVISSQRHGIEELSQHTFGPVSPDGSKFFFRRRKRLDYGSYLSAYIFDLQKLKQVKVFDAQPLVNGEWSKDGKTFVSVSRQPEPEKDTNVKKFAVTFWDGETFEQRKTITVPDLDWWYLTPDGGQFFTTSVPTKKWLGAIPYSNGMANVITVWNTKTGQTEKNLSVGSEDFAVLTWKLMPSPSGRYMAMVSKHKSKDEEHKILFWELGGSDAPKYTIKANPRIRDSGIRYSPDEEFFAIDSGKNVQVYESETGQKKGEIPNADLPDHWLAGNQILLKIFAKKMRALSVTSGEVIYENPLIYESYSSSSTDVSGDTVSTETIVTDQTIVVPHPDGKLYLTYSNQFVRLFKVQSGELTETLVRPPFSVVKQKYSIREKRYVADAGWSPDGEIAFVINYEKNVISLWEFND